MFNTIRSFFENIRQRRFTRKIEREIYCGIFLHLRHDKDCGYPFDSDEEFRTQLSQLLLDTERRLRVIENDGKLMPKAYGEAFRYIVYRDLNCRLREYEKLMRRRIFPQTMDPRFIATPA